MSSSIVMFTGVSVTQARSGSASVLTSQRSVPQCVPHAAPRGGRFAAPVADDESDTRAPPARGNVRTE